MRRTYSQLLLLVREWHVEWSHEEFLDVRTQMRAIASDPANAREVFCAALMALEKDPLAGVEPSKWRGKMSGEALYEILCEDIPIGGDVWFLWHKSIPVLVGPPEVPT